MYYFLYSNQMQKRKWILNSLAIQHSTPNKNHIWNPFFSVCLSDILVGDSSRLSAIPWKIHIWMIVENCMENSKIPHLQIFSGSNVSCQKTKTHTCVETRCYDDFHAILGVIGFLYFLVFMGPTVKIQTSNRISKGLKRPKSKKSVIDSSYSLSSCIKKKSKTIEICTSIGPLCEIQIVRSLKNA